MVCWLALGMSCFGILSFYLLDRRRHRKTFHQSFQRTAVPAYYAAQVKATNIFLLRLLDNPDRFIPHIRELVIL